MKKIIAIIAVLLVILAGLFFIFRSKKTQAPSSLSGNNISTDAKKSPESKDNSGGGIADSLLSFLSKGGVKCSIEDKEGKYTVISSGQKVRIDGISFFDMKDPTGGEKPGTMISDGTWAYVWSGKSGIKFNIKDMEAQAKSAGGAQDSYKSSDWQSWAKDLQASGAKYDCRPAVTSDSDFVAPTDVQFQDLGEMLKQLQNLGNQYKNNMPSLPNISN